MKNRNLKHSLTRFSLLLLAGTALAGCNALGRMADVGSVPELSSIENPTHSPGYQPVSMPMPEPRYRQTAAQLTLASWFPRFLQGLAGCRCR